MAVTLTERAASEIKRVMEQQMQAQVAEAPAQPILRFGIGAGGCSGFEYRFQIEDASATDPEKDFVSEQHGVTLAVDKASDLYLDGTNIDFIDDLNRRGFAINNPNAVRSCGCGSSFQA